MVNIIETLMSIIGPKGEKGDTGAQGLPGVNAVANDAATAGYVGTPGTSATKTALEKKFGKRILTPEAFGAVGDGVANDYEAILATWDAIAPGALVLLEGSYRVTAPTPINGKSKFAIEGSGGIIFDATVASAGGAQIALRLVNCSDYVLRGFSMVCVNQVQEYTGISMTTSPNGRLLGLTVTDFRFTGISVPGASPNVEIDGCVVRRNKFGIFTNGTNQKITNNFVTGDWFTLPESSAPWTPASKHWDGIMLGEGSTGVCANNTILDCGQSGIYGQAGSGWSIIGNLIQRCQNKGIDIGSTSGINGKYFTITGNTCIDNYTSNIHLANTYHSVVSGNSAINTETQYFGQKLDGPPISLTSGCYMVAIVGNIVRQSGGKLNAGIRITAGQTGNEVNANTVDATTKYAVPSGNTLNFALTP